MAIVATSVAHAEAALRDGVPPIELVDGEKLILMMEQLQLGLTPIQSFAIDRAFFDDFGPAPKGAQRNSVFAPTGRGSR